MIIDFLGGTCSFDLRDEVVAYEQGCSLLLCDTVNGSKIKMHNHYNHIKSICFCGDLIASAAVGNQTQLMVSDISTFNRLFSDFLPPLEQVTTNIFMQYHNSQLIILEVFTGYRFLVYDIRQFKLLFIYDADHLNPAFALAYLPTKPRAKLATLELAQVKLWSLNSTGLQLTNKITLRQVRHMSSNSSLNLLVLVLNTGELYVLNSEGDLISQLKSPEHEFTAAASYQQYLYLASRAGMIILYEASTLNFVLSLTVSDQVSYCTSLITSGKLLAYVTNTNCLYVRDLQKKELVEMHLGHSARVNQVTWHPSQKSQFFSASSDGSFSYCSSKGDKYHFEQHPVSHYSAKIKCLLLDPYRDDLYVGDNRGMLYVYSLLDYKFKRQVALTQNVGVKALAFSPAFQYLAVAFRNGFTIVLDCEHQLKPMLKLEDALQNGKYANVRLFQLEFDLVKVSLTPTQKTFYMPRQDKCFNSLTLYNAHSVRQHQIEKGNGVLSALALNMFTVEGLVFGFDMHPSKDYVLVLSSYGFVYIFKMQTTEIRARISVPPFSRILKVDKSGLYFAIAHLSVLNQQEAQLIEIPTIEFLTTNQKINTKTPPTNIRIYECGTGQVAESIANIFQITDFDFSNDGGSLLVGGKEGKMSIWGMSEELCSNAEDVISNMKMNPFFWKDYPIYIDEQETQEQDILDLKLISKKQQNKMIAKTQKYNQFVNPHTLLKHQ